MNDNINKYCRNCGNVLNGDICEVCKTKVEEDRINLDNKYKGYAIVGTIFYFIFPIVTFILMVSAKKKYGFRPIIKILYVLSSITMIIYILILLLITLYIRV